MVNSFEELFNQAGDIFFVLNSNLDILGCNKNFALLYGSTPESLVGKNSRIIYPDFENSVFYESLIETVNTGYTSSRIGYSNNTKRWIAARVTKVDEDKFFVYASTVIENKNSFISLHDALTSISNRFGLEESLDKKYKHHKQFTLFLIDILKFRTINETFGVSQGDMILMEFAARLKRYLGKDVHIYRYNADQFAIVIDTVEEEEIKKVISNIQEIKKEHFLAQSNYITMELAVGYCPVNIFNNSFQDVISYAEIALIKAKKTKNKSAVKFDENEICLGNKHKLIIANELKKALKESDSLVLHYQRQVDCIDKKICGAEALIRWNHPTKGFISPAQFLPVAEEFDLMFDLDKYVFIRAIKDIYILKKNGVDLPISINLSSSSLCNPKIVDLMKTVLSKIDIDPSLITIEITESAFIEEKLVSRQIVENIKKLGMNIALDDFCTGYSSMEYLLSYSADYLKIDREFIRKIDEDSQRKKIVKGLITMAQSLNMSVIAEGVETKEEASLLSSLNCNCIQGFFFGKPQRLEELLLDIKANGYSKGKGQIKFHDNIQLDM